MKEIKKWINDNYPTREKALGMCSDATKKMISVFPELTRVRGKVVDIYSSEYLHWWCVDSSGRIFDPTKIQFDMISEYIQLPDDAPECRYPRQKCMNCGTVYYSDRPVLCSSFCENEFDKWING